MVYPNLILSFFNVYKQETENSTSLFLVMKDHYYLFVTQMTCVLMNREIMRLMQNLYVSIKLENASDKNVVQIVLIVISYLYD